MKKLSIILTITLILVSINAVSQECTYIEEKEKPLIEEFSLMPTFHFGVGYSPTTQRPLANLKVFLVNYGEEYVGAKFLGLGYGVMGNEGGMVFSPFAMNMNKYLLSFDVTHANFNSGAGVTLNITF